MSISVREVTPRGHPVLCAWPCYRWASPVCPSMAMVSLSLPLSRCPPPTTLWAVSRLPPRSTHVSPWAMVPYSHCRPTCYPTTTAAPAPPLLLLLHAREPIRTVLLPPSTCAQCHGRCPRSARASHPCPGLAPLLAGRLLPLLPCDLVTACARHGLAPMHEPFRPYRPSPAQT